MPNTTSFESISTTLLADVSGGCKRRRKCCCPQPQAPQASGSFNFSAQAQFGTAAPQAAPSGGSSVDVSVGYA